MVKHTKGFKGLSKKVLSAILAASMIMTSSSFVMAAEQNGEQKDVMVLQDNGSAMAKAASTNFDDFEATLGGFDVNVDAPSTVPDDRVFKYNGGSEVRPAVVMIDPANNDYTLKEGIDYHLTYDNNTEVYVKVGYATVTIEFDGETYGDIGDVVLQYKVVEHTIDADDVTVVFATEESLVYNGKVQYPGIASVTVRDGENTYQLSPEDYEIEARGQTDHMSVGEHKIRVEAKGNYAGVLSKDYSYEITPAELSGDTATVTVDPILRSDKITATAVEKSIDKSIAVHDDANDRFLTKDGQRPQYEIWYMNEETGEFEESARASVAVGVHQMRIVGVNDYTSYVDATYEIAEENSLQMIVNQALKDGQVTIDDSNYVVGPYGASTIYNGKDQFVDNDEVKFANINSSQYTVTTKRADWTNAGVYYITLEGKNYYEGDTATIPVYVESKALNKDAYKLASRIKAEVKQGTHRSGAEGSLEVVIKDNKIGQTLQEGVDYTVGDVVTEAQGVKRVVITGIGNYTTKVADTSVYKAKIDKSEKLYLNDESISAEVLGNFVYTGSDIEPTASDIKLVETDGNNQYEITDADFYVKDYSNNINAGEATVTIKAKSASKYYEGERDITFTIAGLDFAETFKLAPISDVAIGSTWDTVLNDIQVRYQSNNAVYSSYNKPKDRCIYEILKDGKRVTDTEIGDGKGEIKESGTYTVVVKPIDSRYGGSLETTFNVTGVDIAQNTTVSDIEDQVYTGEAIEPKVTVKNDNMTLEEGKDYTLSYSGNVEGGTAVVIINGIGNYSGKIEKEFTITQGQQELSMTNPLQERDLANGSRTTKSKVCTLKLGYALEDKNMSLSYATSDPSVATVSDGKITYKGVGECTITVTAKETNNCKADTLEIKVVVGKPGQPTFTPSVTSKTAKKSFVVTSSTIPGADGFEVQYSVRSDWWRASTVDFDGTTSGKLYRQTIKTYHSNKTYYIRVRAYQVVDGEKVYSDWSPVKTATTK